MAFGAWVLGQGQRVVLGWTGCLHTVLSTKSALPSGRLPTCHRPLGNGEVCSVCLEEDTDPSKHNASDARLGVACPAVIRCAEPQPE